MAQLKSREVFLIAQDEGLSRQLEELRGCLRERDSLIQTAKEGSSKAILKLESESSGWFEYMYCTCMTLCFSLTSKWLLSCCSFSLKTIIFLLLFINQFSNVLLYVVTGENIQLVLHTSPFIYSGPTYRVVVP